MTTELLEQFSRDLRNAVTNYEVDDRTWENCRRDWMLAGKRLAEKYQIQKKGGCRKNG